ncbi:MAG TPA: hypothetical protein GXZ48_04510, partial [Acholeplasmataceae bacterium]|nr:hypothetical protein [Acholeplasmataceae bacterium]
MGKRVFIYIITILVVGFVLYLNIAPGRPVIKLDEFDHYVNENSFNKYDINFIRVRKDDSNIVDYYLKVNGKYYVVFDEKEYKNIDPVQLDIESTYENKYIDFYIYDEYGNKIDVIKVYYSQNYEKLTHLFWSSYDETIIYLIVFGITFLMILSDLIVYLLTRKRKPKVLSPNIKESFRNAPLNKKIGYLVILLIYLVLPFPFLLIFGIAL